jgi:hypothetical protein
LKIKRTFALPFEKRVADKGREFLPRLTLKKNLENFCEKVWRLKNKAYLCNPNQKGASSEETRSSLKRLIYCTRSKYRENTIYREALISL